MGWHLPLCWLGAPTPLHVVSNDKEPGIKTHPTCLASPGPCSGGSLDPFPSGPPSRGRARQNKAPAKPQEEPPYPYDKVPPTQREACSAHCPSAPTYPSDAASTACGSAPSPGWTMLSKVRGQLTTQLPLYHWCPSLYLLGSYEVWGGEVPGLWARLAAGQCPPYPALGAVEASRLVGGGRLAGDTPGWDVTFILRLPSHVQSTGEGEL